MSDQLHDDLQNYFNEPNTFEIERKDQRCTLVNDDKSYTLTKRTVYTKQDPKLKPSSYAVFIDFQLARTISESKNVKRDSRKFPFNINDTFLYLGLTDDRKQRHIMHRPGLGKCKSANCKCTDKRTDIPSECFELLDNKIQGPFSVLSFGFVRRKRQPAGLKIKLPPDTIVVEADIDGHNTFIEQKMVACLFKKEMFANESRELQLPINLTSLEHIEQRTALATMLNTLFDFQTINPSQGEPVLRERTKAEKQKKKPIQKRILPKRKRKETTENTSIASTTNTTSTTSTEKKVKQLFYNSSFEALKQVVEQNVKEETNEIKQKSEALLEVLNECIMSTDGQVGPDDLTEPEDNFDISDPKIINTSTSRLSESGSLSQTPLEYFQQWNHLKILSSASSIKNSSIIGESTQEEQMNPPSAQAQQPTSPMLFRESSFQNTLTSNNSQQPLLYHISELASSMQNEIQ